MVPSEQRATHLETIVLHLPTALDAALAAEALRSGRSKSEIVTAILQAHLTLEVSHPNPDPVLSDRLVALQDRLTQIEHHLTYYQLAVQKHRLSHSPLLATVTDADEIEDEPDEVLEGFL